MLILKNKPSLILSFLLFITLLLLSPCILIYSTKWGIGTSPDSAAYIGVASNLIIGKGLTIPYGNPPDQFLTFFPPLYPVLLSLGGIFGDSLLQSTRWLHAILLSANLLVFWFYMRMLMPAFNIWLATLFLIPMVFAGPILNLHVMAWSEALFLLCGFGGLLLVTTGLIRKQNALLWSGGILVGLSCLTRYSGIVFLATVALVVLLLVDKDKWWKRILFSLYVSAPGIIMISMWIGYNFIISGTIASRSFEFHPIQITRFQQGLDTIANWFLIPLSLPGLVKMGIIGLFVSLLLTLILKNFKSLNGETRALFLFLVAFSLAYPAFLVVSISFFDANTPLDDRILSPLFVVLWIIIAAGISHFLSLLNKYPKMNIFLVFIAILLFSSLGASKKIPVFQSYHNSGIGFSHAQWRESELIEQINRLPQETKIITNSPEGVYLLTGRPSTPLPRKIDLTRQQQNQNYQTDMSKLNQEIMRGDTVIVYFSKIQSTAIPTILEINNVINTQIKRSELSDGFLVGGSN